MINKNKPNFYDFNKIIVKEIFVLDVLDLDRFDG